ncbi:hypothetical protein AADEFJLK_02697 [Methylovulum psychrotolerans]|uniref:Uncharacterized protein n=1 Tax=Methylovulum psychrotolerans TaxID=1704499 RepID=A0A2S5CKB0_9GAMM|nr:hypothetical protein AADEFJLK_02697 [Methylovulum psychrotolerans]
MAGLGDKIGDQTLIARHIFSGNDNRFADTGTLAQAGFDFAQFDTEAADFDLAIVAPPIFYCPVGQPTPQVAGFVQAARALAERVLDKAFGAQFGAVQITPRHTRAANMDFAHHPQRYGLPVRV